MVSVLRAHVVVAVALAAAGALDHGADALRRGLASGDRWRAVEHTLADRHDPAGSLLHIDHRLGRVNLTVVIDVVTDEADLVGNLLAEHSEVRHLLPINEDDSVLAVSVALQGRRNRPNRTDRTSHM